MALYTVAPENSYESTTVEATSARAAIAKISREGFWAKNRKLSAQKANARELRQHKIMQCVFKVGGSA